MARAIRSGSRADIALAVICGALAVLAISLPAAIQSSLAGGLRATVLVPIVALQARAERARAAYGSYEMRSLTIDSVSRRAMERDALSDENERLRKVIGLGRRLGWGFIPAEAISAGGAGRELTLTLTAGGNAGVRRFSPVIAPEGLVGMVDRVDPTMSLAILWTSPDFRVSAMAADGSVFGIAAAHLGEGSDDYLLELSGVAFRDSLAKGTLVVSSGLGGTYPRGIPVGTVIRELSTSEGWARRYLLRPAVFPPDVHAVMVLRPERGAAGVRGIWDSPAGQESALRRVVAAGDSLARAGSAAAFMAPPPRPPSGMLPGSKARAASDSARMGVVRPPAAGAAAVAVTPEDSAARAARAARRRRARADSIARAAARRDSAARALPDGAVPPVPRPQPDTAPIPPGVSPR